MTVLRSIPAPAQALLGSNALAHVVTLNSNGTLELTRFGGHLTSWEDVHDAEGKAAVSA